MIWRDALAAVGVMSEAGDLRVIVTSEDGLEIGDATVRRAWIHESASYDAYRAKPSRDCDDMCSAECFSEGPTEVVVVSGEGVERR